MTTRNEADDLNDRAAKLLLTPGNADEAIELCTQGIKIDPTLAPLYSNLGKAYAQQDCHALALVSYEKALDLEPNATIFNINYADALNHLGRYEEAIDFCQHAIMLRPDAAEAFNNMAVAFWGLNLLQQALAAWRTATALQPNMADAHQNRGIVLLMLGKYQQGFEEFDWRFAAKQARLRPFGDKIFNGGFIEGGEIIVWSEQGIGDEILQASLIDDATARCKRVIWECDPRLLTLLQRSFPRAEVIARVPEPLMPEVSEKFIGHCPGFTLARFLRPHPSMVPQRLAYLVPDQDRWHGIRKQMNIEPGQKIIGISWRSASGSIGAHKSTRLFDWLPVIAQDGYRFIDLQYGDTAEERSHTGLLEHVEGLDLRDDIEGLAALISLCNEVITVSNINAHIAGALGIPCTVLASATGGKLWYWGTTETKTPWYPSITIERPAKGETFVNVLARIAKRLGGQS